MSANNYIKLDLTTLEVSECDMDSDYTYGKSVKCKTLLEACRKAQELQIETEYGTYFEETKKESAKKADKRIR